MVLAGTQIVRFALAIALVAAGALATTQGMVTASHARSRDGTLPFAPGRTPSGLASAAQRGVIAGDYAAAIAPARQSLVKRPLDPVTLRNLAIAQFETGNVEGFERSLTLASRLGWRDPATQLLLFQIATDSGDANAAAIRFDALARQKFRPEEMKAAMRRFLLVSGAPGAMAERLASLPPWREEYLQATDPLPSKSYRPWLDMLVAMKQSGTKAAPRPVEYSAFERTLVAYGKIPLAIEASRKVGALGNAPASGFGALAQGGNVSPFVWSVAPGRETTVSQPEPGLLNVTIDGQSGGELVQRVFPINPGMHRFSVQIEQASGDTDRALRWSVTCLPNRTELEPELTRQANSQGRTETVAFVVPADCLAARIALTAVAGQIRGDYSLTVSHARLD